ncbi:S8 family serine peptidase, partial [bacterium]|nr:S8 family serine peptidase [bacterium]
EIIVKYKPGVDPDYMAVSTAGSGYSAVKGSNKTGRGAVRILKLDHAEKALHLTSSIRDRTLKEIERLNNLPYVEYAEPNYIFRAQFTPDDTEYTKQWHYPLIKIDKVWSDSSLTSLNDLSSVTVAVIDSGIVRYLGNDHPDLSGIFRDEYDFISRTIISADDDGLDDDATDPIISGSFFHGTHVAGTIGALTNNGAGVAGVAGGYNSGVRIMPLRVLGWDGDDYGIGYSNDFAQAILYAAGLTNDYNVDPPAQKADVINLSIGGPHSQYVGDAITDAYAAGVTIVAAAGNESTKSPSYPAAYPEVISVAAVDVGAVRAYYSNYGDTIDIAAPGGDMTPDGGMRFDLNFDGIKDGIYSTLFDGVEQFIYDYMSGTSMATPHVAGVAALIIKALGNPSPSTVKNILTGTAIDLGNSEFYGAGLVNAHAAASKAFGQAQPQIPVLHPFPKTVLLDGLTSSGSFTLKNIGNSTSINIINITKENEDPS